MQEFARVQHEQEDNAIKLFANLYAPYFRGFWKLDELTETGEKVLSESGLEEKEIEVAYS